MYRTDFYITKAVKNNIQKFEFVKVHGWGETFEAPDGTIIEIRLDKRLKQWHITEKSTGFAITPWIFLTRAEALATITPELLQKTAQALKTPRAVQTANLLSEYILRD